MIGLITILKYFITQHGGKIMKLGIKDNKIWDVCSDLRNKRDDSLPDKNYLDLPMNDWIIGDSWDVKNKVSLKDAPIRFEEKPKTEIELRLEAIELKVEKLEKEVKK